MTGGQGVSAPCPQTNWMFTGTRLEGPRAGDLAAVALGRVSGQDGSLRPSGLALSLGHSQASARPAPRTAWGCQWQLVKLQPLQKGGDRAEGPALPPLPRGPPRP